MSWIIGILITLIVTSVSLLVISKLPLGIQVDSFGQAFVAALVFGILNAIAWPLLVLLTLPIINFLLFPILLLLNALIFGLTAKLVAGFRLKNFWSAILGAIALSMVNRILFWGLAHLGVS